MLTSEAEQKLEGPAHLFRTFVPGAWIALALAWVFLTAKLFLSYKLLPPTGLTWGLADDAYITADFARTLAHGGGPRWYEGAPKIEGFSSPLWMLAMAGLHLLPGFKETSLGIYVLALNACILLGCAWALVRGIESTVHLAEPESRLRPPAALVAALLGAAATISLCSWASRGFEVALVAVLALLAYAEAVRPPGFRGPLLGLWIGLSFWARMDAVLYCVPAMVAAAQRAHRQHAYASAARAAAVAAMLIVSLFAVRRAYFGDWLPNTYYLKATNWPVARRLPRGIDQNVLSILGCAIGLPPIWFLLARRRVPGALLLVGLTITQVLVVAYSTCLGGDFSFESFGYDRFTAISSVFLLLGLCAALLMIPLSPLARTALGAWCGALLALPLVFRPAPFHAGSWQPKQLFKPRQFPWTALFSPTKRIHRVDDFAQLFVYYGKLIKFSTLPAARAAVCAAGAPIYFSHRGGVDLLGKVDPVIARLPATADRPPESRCWMGGVGHNKEAVALSFQMHWPDFSLVEPPALALSRYLHFKIGYIDVWVLRQSHNVNWSYLTTYAQR